MIEQPRVMFLCVSNSGKSQMAAALMRRDFQDVISVRSAGTTPKQTLNEESVASLAEVDASVEGEHPKAIDPELMRSMDVVVVLGSQAKVEPVPGPEFQTWLTDEPSARGIEGMERMRLIRDDIAARVEELADRLLDQPAQ